MAGLASLAVELGHRVTGSDANAWPPMSDQLRALGIEVMQGYVVEHLEPCPDQTIIGNALTRGNPAVEHILDHQLPYVSGPGWLAQHLLRDRWVLAVSGTHGKTTTSAMLAWILESAGLRPGFLIGGVPQNFGVSARIGDAPYFVIEADEYDTAFFDKRSKFVHYHPKTLIINNIEHDHVDIFPDIESIYRQFHHLVRIVPSQGQIVYPAADEHVRRVLELGCWTPVRTTGLGGDWTATRSRKDDSEFEVHEDGQPMGRVQWPLIGEHNVSNALAALAAARHIGLDIETAARSLTHFENVKRRLEHIGTVNDISVYDDFAHHPTAIRTTVAGLRARVGDARILAVLDPRSNSMRAGLHRETLAQSLLDADKVWLHAPSGLDWNPEQIIASLGSRGAGAGTVDDIVSALRESAKPGDHVLLMSNGAFGGIYTKLLDALEPSN